MKADVPAIVSAAESMLVGIEQAVCRWARYHRHAHGLLLRQQAMAVAQAAHKSWRDKAGRAQRLRELDEAIGNLKLSLQLGRLIRAFSSGRQFHMFIIKAEDLGKQCGALIKYNHSRRPESGAVIDAAGASQDTECPPRPYGPNHDEAALPQGCAARSQAGGLSQQVPAVGTPATCGS